LSPFWRRVGETIRDDFVAGLLSIVPVVATVVGVLWALATLDDLILPKVYQLFGLEGDQPALVGTVVTFAAIILTGALTRSVLGRWLLATWEHFISRVPVARSLYSVLKQFMQAVFGQSKESIFQRVVLVEYPRKGVWRYALVTGRVEGQIPGTVPGLTRCFVPSTPNATTGFMILIPESDIVETGLTVEEAFRGIVSAGIAGGAEAKILERGAKPPQRLGVEDLDEPE
jgi:uncharacterized membrane protein